MVREGRGIQPHPRKKEEVNFMVISPLALSLIGVGVLLVLLALGMSIGISMFAVGFFGCLAAYLAKGLSFAQASTAAFIVFKRVPFTQATNYSFVVIPLFILMGQICFYSGMSAGLYDMCHKLLGTLRGGLAMASVAACALFGAICGSAAATAATMGVVALPEMKKHGYSDSLSTASIAAGGTLGILIPPSTGFILYGIVSGESVGKLFAAGIIPGIIMALCFCVTIAIWCKVKPDAAPDKMKFTVKEKLISLKGGLPMVVLFVVVIGGILTGFFTAVEGSAVGVVVSFIYLCIKKQANMKNIIASLKDTVTQSGMIFLILIGAYVFGNFLTVTQLPTTLASFVNTLTVSRWIVMIVILIIYAIMGCFMDSLAMVMLTVPIFYPIIISLGFDGIWYGVIMVMVMQLGLITPPVGMSAYIIQGVAKDVSLATVFKGLVPLVLAMVVSIAIVCFVPQSALLLANLVTV